MTTEEAAGATVTDPTRSSADARSSYWGRAKDHKVVQWTLAYAAAAYTLLHAVEMVSEALDWPHLVVRLVTILLFLGAPIATTLAWYHGHRAQSRVSGPELAILTVLLVIAGSVLWFIGRPSHEHASAKAAESQGEITSAPVERSIAVLPFVDMSEKRDQEYFGDGMAEEVIDVLVRIPGLHVIGRTSSFQFKGKSEDLREVGRKLGSTYILEGSVRKAAGRLRVTAQLIDTRNGAHKWSESYDRDAADVLKVQSEIALALARALQLEVAGSGSTGSSAAVQNQESYDAYLRGLHAQERFDQPGFEEAIADFRRALELDPSFIPATEALAFVLRNQADWEFSPPPIGWEQTRAAASQAIKLNPQSALGHAILGDVHTEYDWDWLAAERELNLALSLAPRDPRVLLCAGVRNLAVGQWVEAVRLFDAELSADPLDPSAHAFRAWAYMRLGRFGEAARDQRQLLEFSPTFGWAHYYLGIALLQEGKNSEALAEMEKEAPASGQVAGLAAAYYALIWNDASSIAEVDAPT